MEQVCLKCVFCGSFQAKSLRGLSKHHRNCNGNTTGKSSKNNEPFLQSYKCQQCGTYCAKTLRGLSNHQGKCRKQNYKFKCKLCNRICDFEDKKGLIHHIATIHNSVFNEFLIRNKDDYILPTEFINTEHPLEPYIETSILNYTRQNTNDILCEDSDISENVNVINWEKIEKQIESVVHNIKLIDNMEDNSFCFMSNDTTINDILHWTPTVYNDTNNENNFICEDATLGFVCGTNSSDSTLR